MPAPHRKHPPTSTAADSHIQSEPQESLSRAIGRGTAVIVLLGLLDKLLAVGKEVLMASRFGIEAKVDAFNIAYAFPGIANLIFNFACVSAFVPLYALWRENDRVTPRQLRDNTLTVLYGSLLFFGLLSGLCSLMAPTLLGLLGYGFSPATLASSVAMERLLVWLIFLEGAGVIAAALLQAWKRFAALTLAQALINAAIIIFLALCPGMGINALIYGFLVGTGLKVAAMLVCLRGTNLRPLAPFSPAPQALRRFAAMGWPLLGSALIANSNILIDQSMSTSLPEGGVAILRYAYRLNDLPLQLIIIALSRAIFPFISEQSARGDSAGLRQVFRQSLVVVGLISLPLICYMLIFADDIVTLLLRRGAFDASAAQATARTLRCYSLGLFFHAYAFINGSFFAALGLGVVLFRLGIVTLALNFGFNWLFLRLLLQPEALALSTTATMTIIALVFFKMLAGRLGRGVLRDIAREFILIGCATVAAVAACFPLRALAAAHGISPWFSLIPLSLVYAAILLAVLIRFKTGEIAKAVVFCQNALLRRRSSS